MHVNLHANDSFSSIFYTSVGRPQQRHDVVGVKIFQKIISVLWHQEPVAGHSLDEAGQAPTCD